ncbi:MAG: hydroxyacid dehydrogenase [Pseudomonadota bacterium]|nr:hydroxyacid dehydrogenase [Pseudomonadota bacterium]
MARIVVCEFMDAPGIAAMRAVHEVVYEPTLVDDPAALHALAAAADALVVRNRTQVRGALLASLTRCRLVGRLGVGLDNIDVPACQARGIAVVPATGANARSVAEYVIAAAMLLLRGVYGASDQVAAGRWPREALSWGREIGGKRLGLVGFGSIGRVTADLARAVGMQVVAFDAALPAGDPAYRDHGVEPLDLDAVVSSADVVSIHVPLLDSTRGLFDAARIATMQRGAVLVNAARGGIVDEAALAAALKSGQLGGAALDVFATEPLAAGSVLADCPNLILTPHVAGPSLESNQRVSLLIAEKILEGLR